MSQSTKIEWATKVWNPVTGCNKVSQGCKFCYAETVANRFWVTRKFTDVQMHEDRLQLPNWKTPQRVFVNSMSDLFHESVSFEFINEVFYSMQCADLHTFLILTKRPQRMLDFFNWIAGSDNLAYVPFLNNVWLGVSVEDQTTANERIPLLLQVPAAVRWLSCEPLLGKVDLQMIQGTSPFKEFYQVLKPITNFGDANRPAIDWVVVGGESGAKARPMHPDWARSLRDQCKAAEVPFFFKQWGAYVPGTHKLANDNALYIVLNNGEKGRYWKNDLTEKYANDWQNMGANVMRRIGKSKAGRLLDGVEYNEFPNTNN